MAFILHLPSFTMNLHRGRAVDGARTHPRLTVLGRCEFEGGHPPNEGQAGDPAVASLKWLVRLNR